RQDPRRGARASRDPVRLGHAELAAGIGIGQHTRGTRHAHAAGRGVPRLRMALLEPATTRRESEFRTDARRYGPRLPMVRRARIRLRARNWVRFADCVFLQRRWNPALPLLGLE